MVIPASYTKAFNSASGVSASSAVGSDVSFQNNSQLLNCSTPSAQPAGEQLDNVAKSVGSGVADSRSDVVKRGDKRNLRWRALGTQWEHSSIDRIRTCGRVTHSSDGGVDVRRSGDMVGYAGLVSCGSVHACPRCASRILAERRAELGRLMEGVKAKEYSLAFSTVTLRHKKGQPLGWLWDVTTKGYQSVGQSRKVRRLRAALGRIGYVRRVEVTYGDSGWHPHIHAIHVFDRPITQEQLDELADAEFEIWKRQAVKRGLGAPMREFYDMQLVSTLKSGTLDDYLAKGSYEEMIDYRIKGSVQYEMAAPHTKEGRRRGSRAAFRILEDFRETGDLDDLDLWHEYEQASKGKRLLVWSPGLKDMFNVDEKDDQEIVDEEVGEEEDSYLFTVTDWEPIGRNSELGGQLLAAVEIGGLEGGRDFCLLHGIATEIRQRE